ncbi:MAG TPA: MFS transporter [Verrucomicrobiae bacterium]|nr:MFS transporter [Verrucomicrobiae bacterium]
MNEIPYFRLSALMFLEYAVWGAWMPVLAARLLGPLKMNGKQTGWIYATLPLATMISPLLAGQLADKYLDTGWILAVCHAIGAVLLFAAARTRKFWPLFGVMLAYSMFYGATIPLVNSLMFSHLTDADKQSPGIFIWAPVAWALIGYALTGWRNLRKGEGDGSDCLVLGGILSIAMTIVCLIQPATPPSGAEGVPLFKAVSMLGDANFAVFIIASLVVAGVMQFYFLGSARYLQDIGVSQKNVPATMAIAQAAQAIATLFALGLLLKTLGAKWTLTAGAASWALLYLIYVIGQPKWLLVAGQVLHGFAYVFFMIAGQIYVNSVAQPDIRGSAQGLIILVTTGIGLFLGTQLAGFVMDRSSVDGKFNWARVYMVPFLCTLAGVLALATAFHA